MNDQIDTSKLANPIRRGGWPKGKPRPKKTRPDWDSDGFDKPSPMIAKMKSRPNWESDDFVGAGADNGFDRLSIRPEVIDALWRDGVALQWVTRAVRGMETPQELGAMTRGGWTPVHQSDFDGALNGVFMSKGIDEVITVDDCMLVARPAEMQKKAKANERKIADEHAKRPEHDLIHGGGVPGTGGRHVTIRNQINRGPAERIEIPED